MKTIILSDLHGELINITEEFELMIICGDICPVSNHNRQYQYEWLTNDFVEWVNALPVVEGGKIVFCAGNHDFVLENITKTKLNGILNKCKNLVYLLNETYDYFDNDGNKWVLCGTPYCKQFGNWAFMREYDRLNEIYNEIPKDVDILFSHDAADINDLGLIKSGRHRGVNAGNVELAKAIKEKTPKYYFCGHIHSGTHELTDVDGTKMANVCIMNEYYYPEYQPLIIDINKR